MVTEVLNRYAQRMIEATHSIHRTQIIVGVLALLLGVLIYLFDRPAEHIYFISHSISFFNYTPNLFGIMGNHLPTFLHVFAFSMIMAGIIGCNKRGALAICSIWMLINIGFEIGQYQDIAMYVTPLIPDWFSHIPILENTEYYFLYGKYDPYDVLAGIIGAVSAYIVIIVTIKA